MDRIIQDRGEGHLRCSRQGGIATHPGRSDAHELSRSRQGTADLGFHSIGGNGIDSAEVAAKDDRFRIEHIDQVGQPDTEPVGHVVEGRAHARGAALDRLQEHRQRAIDAGRPRERSKADLGLPAPSRTTPTGAPLRIDAHVADLSAVATRPDKWMPIHEEAPADADVTGEVEHGAAVTGTAPQVLGKHPQISVVANAHITAPCTDAFQEESSQGYVGPAQVGREAHKTVGPSDDTGDTRARAHPCATGRQRAERLTTDLGDVVDEGVAIAIKMTSFGAGEDLAAETDQCRLRALDAKVERQDGDGSRHRLDHERRPTHSAYITRSLPDEAEGRQGRHQVSHRAAIESRERGQL